MYFHVISFIILADIKLALETILRGNGGSVTKYLLQKRKTFHVCLFTLVSIRIIFLKLKNNSSSLNVDFHDFISPFSPSLVLVSIEKIYQTLKIVFDHISKHLEIRQKYSAARRMHGMFENVLKHGVSCLICIYHRMGPRAIKN